MYECRTKRDSAGRWVAVAGGVALAVSMGACAGPKGGAAEPSVRPGINDPYFEDPSVEKWAARFEVESREVYVERERIVAAMGLRPGMAVADVGAGTGLFTWLMAERVGTGGVVYAVDIVPEFVEHVAEEARSRGAWQVRAVQCGADEVRLAAGSIDAALIVDTYHHFEYPRATMESLYRALRAGGEVTVVDFERIPGVSRPWVLEHVRAGRETVIEEIEAAGFTLAEDGSRENFLEENYLIRFRKK